MHVQASRILASNYRGLETGSKADLAKCLNKFQDSQLFYGTDYPNKPGDIPVVCDKMIDHATGKDDVLYKNTSAGSTSTSSHKVLWPIMKKDLLWKESRDVWHLYLDPLWADFHGTRATGARPVPLIDAFPLDIWLYKEPEELYVKNRRNKNERAKMQLLVQIESIINIQLNHYQLLFLMRLLETFGEITTFLTQDVSHILGEDDESSMVLGLVAPQVDVSLLMPSVSQSRDGIGGDYDTSVPLDSNTSLYTMADVKGESLASSPPLTLTLNSQATTPRQQISPSQSLVVPTDAEPPISAPVSPSRSRKPGTTIPVAASQPCLEGIHSPAPKAKNGKKKKSSLTSSLSNMISSLDIRSGTTTQQAHLEDGDSDDSGDSESFVVIDQAVTEDTVDSTLFAIHSKRASPVEFATEVTEDDLKSYVSTPSKSGVNLEAKRDGVVSF